MSKRLDWAEILRVGLVHLGLTPEALWRLTPAEFQLLLPERAGSAAMQMAELEHLMGLYPDGEPQADVPMQMAGLTTTTRTPTDGK